MDKNSPLKIYADSSVGLKNSWMDYFPTNTGNEKYLMEATTHNIFQDKMLEHLRNRNDDLKLLVLLREPAARIRSSFYYTKFNASYIQKSINFEKYVSDLLDNNPMDYIRNKSSRFVLERELYYSTYIDHLRKYKSFFENGSLYIGFFEDLKSNPVSFYASLFNWLNIDFNTEELELKKMNQTYQPKSEGFQNIAARLNRRIKKVPFKSTLKSLYLKYFTDKIIDSDDESSMFKLREYFKEHNTKLEKEFGLDISVWN